MIFVCVLTLIHDLTTTPLAANSHISHRPRCTLIHVHIHNLLYSTTSVFHTYKNVYMYIPQFTYPLFNPYSSLSPCLSLPPSLPPSLHHVTTSLVWWPGRRNGLWADTNTCTTSTHSAASVSPCTAAISSRPSSLSVGRMPRNPPLPRSPRGRGCGRGLWRASCCRRG